MSGTAPVDRVFMQWAVEMKMLALNSAAIPDVPTFYDVCVLRV